MSKRFTLSVFAAVALCVSADTCSGTGECPEQNDQSGFIQVKARKSKAESECAETQAISDQYGSAIGANGELFELDSNDIFYTWQGFQDAVCKYNAMAATSGKPKFLGDANSNINGLTLVGFMANLKVETMNWTACKERVRLADGTCPCDTQPGCTGGCSGGKLGDYTSAKAAAAGFSVTTCGGLDAPTQGCTDFWGNTVADPKDCWFGRGATQLTWPGNYGGLQQLVKDASGEDICADPDSICQSDSIAWLTAIAYWQQNSAPWDAAHTFQSSLQVIRPADTSANPKRQANWDSWTAALSLTPPPTPAPAPSSGTITVQSGDGCWQIADRVCPGKGNDFATIICDPPACSPGPAAGASVTYNCNGC